jgi:hypothetical protein
MSPHTTRSRGCNCFMLVGRNLRMIPYWSINFMSSSAVCTDALSHTSRIRLAGNSSGPARRLLLLSPRRQYSLNVHDKPPCVHPRLGLAGDNVPIHVLQIPAHMLKLLLLLHRLSVFLVPGSLETLPLFQAPTRCRSCCVGWKLFGLPGLA